MDNNENDLLRQNAENSMNEDPSQQAAPEEPAQQPAQPGQTSSVYAEIWQPGQAQPYHGVGTGRRESPFADSPYQNVNTGWNGPETRQPNYQAQSAYQQTPPQTPPPVPPVQPWASAQPAQPPKQPKAKKKRSGRIWRSVIAAVLVVAVVAAGCGITAVSVNRYWEQKTSQLVGTLNQRIQSLEQQAGGSTNSSSGSAVPSSPVSTGSAMSPSQVYNQNVQSVVAISNHSTVNYFGQITETASSGSGFIISSDGYVVTNYHVVENATELEVITSDETKYEAEYIGGDSSNDIALLKINGENLPAVTLGSSDALVVGEQVVAIGNPLGELTSTLTVGYISAKDRDVTTDNSPAINMLQTDAAINPGNSGGPLFNMYGEVVGITSAKYSGTTSSGASIEGIGFAIPIDDVSGMIQDLMDYGYVTGAYLGVTVRDMDPSVAESYDFPVGAYVDSITTGSCAEKAGMRAKDIIIDVGGYQVDSVSDLKRALRHFDAGDTTTVTVFRGGQEVTLNITLDEKPNDAETDTPAETTPMPSDGSYDDWYEYFSPFFGNTPPSFGG